MMGGSFSNSVGHFSSQVVSSQFCHLPNQNPIPKKYGKLYKKECLQSLQKTLSVHFISVVKIKGSVLKLFGFYVNFGHFAGWYPYFYSKKKGEFLYQETKWYWRRRCLNLGLVFLYEILLIARAVQSSQDESVGAAVKIRTVLFAIMHLLMNLGHFINFRNGGEHHKVLNAILESMNLRLDDDAGKIKSPPTRTKMALLTLIISNAFAFVMRALPALTKPEKPGLFSSLAPNPRALPLWAKMGICLIHMNITGFHIFSTLIHAAVHAIYVAGMVPVISHMCAQNNKDNKNNNNNKNYQNNKNNENNQNNQNNNKNQNNQNNQNNNNNQNNKKNNNHGSRGAGVNEMQARAFARGHYRLHVLQNAFKSVFGLGPLALELMALCAVILNFYLAVTFLEVRSLIRGMMCLGIVVLFFSDLASVHEVSMGMVQSWKRNLRRDCPRWFIKFCTSVQPLSVSVGGFFYADRAFLLTVISIAINQTSSLILTFRH